MFILHCVERAFCRQHAFLNFCPRGVDDKFDVQLKLLCEPLERFNPREIRRISGTPDDPKFGTRAAHRFQSAENQKLQRVVFLGPKLSD
jgi:hypothetical protein